MRHWIFLLCLCLCGVWAAPVVRGQAVQTPSTTAEPLVIEQPPVEEEPGGAPGGDLEAPPISLNVSGTVSFGVRYGFGDGRGLAQRGYSQGFGIQQLLALNLDGGVPVTFPLEGLFTVSAQLNSQQADNLQSLAMHFDSEHLVMDLGDFFVGENAPYLIVPDRKLKGFKAVASWDDLSVTGAFARVEGIAETKTFRGNTSTDSALFSSSQPDRPWLPQTYLRQLRGLEHYPLPGGFVDGFSKVELDLHPGAELDELLSAYGLDYLLDGLAARGPQELSDGQFVILRPDAATFLVLMREGRDLLRDRLRDAIDDHNREADLQGEDRKEYPFNDDTDFELGFLQQLQAIATLDVDDDALPLDGAERGRFFYLGHREVDADTFMLEVTVDGQFVDINDPLLFAYEARLFEAPGLVSLDFPADFFEQPENQIRASYSYTSTSGIYILGLSIVKGSDRVFLNGGPLQRDVDYSIDYETGALLLFQQVTRDDLLRIEYEVLRGGLGGYTEYQRNLTQLSLALAPLPWLAVNLDLFQGADLASVEDGTRLRTMPNTHTVAGLRAQAELGLPNDLGTLQSSLVLGYNLNAFPLDDNLRQNLPNQVNAIAVLEHEGRSYALFGHQNGLTTYDGVRWSTYDTRSGLSGRSVNDIAMNRNWIALATEAGVTLVRLEGEDPFDLIPNWHRFYQQDGLADNRALSVAFAGNTLWVGTGDGITAIDLSGGVQALEAPERWRSYLSGDHDLLNAEIARLRVWDELLYLGGENGLQTFDPRGEAFSTDPSLLGGAVYAIVPTADGVYVAGDRGVRVLVAGRGAGWLTSAGPVYALVATEDAVWLATADGLRVVGAGRVPAGLQRVAIRALGVQHGAIWVGPAAVVTGGSGEGGPLRYALDVTRFNAQEVKVYASDTTGINGRDLNRFGEVPLGEHLDLGGLGELAVSYRLSGFVLTAALEARAETFTEIGSQSRDEYVRWRLRADYDVFPNVSVFAEHVAGFGRTQASDNLGLSWKDGAQLNVSYREDLTQRDEVRARLAVDLAQDFFDEALELRLKLEDEGARRLGRDRRSEDLTFSGALGWQVSPGLRLELDLESPLRFSTDQPLRGSLQMGGSANWTTQIPLGALNLSVDHENDARFPYGGGTLENGLDAGLVWDAISWEGVRLSPRTTLRFDQRSAGPFDETTTLSLGNVLQLRWEEFGAQLRWDRDQGYSLRNQTENVQHAVSARLDYSGWDTLSPGLDWSWTGNALRHPVLGDKAWGGQQWGLRLGWDPDRTLRADASLSAEFSDQPEEQTTRYGLQVDASQRLLETVDLSLSVQGGWSAGVRRKEPFETLSLDVTLGGNWRFAEDWVANFSVGTFYGADAVDPGNDTLSYVASAQAAMNF